MSFELDDPIARREKQEKESLLSEPSEAFISKPACDAETAEEEVSEILDVLDTIGSTKPKKIYKE